MNNKSRMGHVTAIVCWCVAAINFYYAAFGYGITDPMKILFVVIGTVLAAMGVDAWIKN